MSALNFALAALGQKSAAKQSPSTPNVKSGSENNALKRKISNSQGLNDVKKPKTNLEPAMSTVATNKDTAQSSPSTAPRPKPVVNAPTPANKPPSRPTSALGRPVSSTKPRPGGTGPTATAPSRPPVPKAESNAPKRGYAALMERAKAQQASKPVAAVGAIKHKPLDKMTSKERRAMGMGKGALHNKKGALAKSAASSSHASPSDALPGKRGPPPKDDKRSRDITGQKRSEEKPRRPEPVAPSYRGTMKSAGVAASRSQKRSKMNEYEEDGFVEYDEDSEDAYGRDEEDGYGYSDESSDMEAAFDEMEEENHTSLRQAQQDDAKEKAILDAHAREKAARKQALADLAAKRRR